jgi:hypothetical protein
MDEQDPQVPIAAFIYAQHLGLSAAACRVCGLFGLFDDQFATFANQCMMASCV